MELGVSDHSPLSPLGYAPGNNTVTGLEDNSLKFHDWLTRCCLCFAVEATDQCIAFESSYHVEQGMISSDNFYSPFSRRNTCNQGC